MRIKAFSFQSDLLLCREWYRCHYDPRSLLPLAIEAERRVECCAGGGEAVPGTAARPQIWSGLMDRWQSEAP